MKHKAGAGILLTIATLVVGKSKKLRWLAPVLPVAVAVYRKAMMTRQAPGAPPARA